MYAHLFNEKPLLHGIWSQSESPHTAHPSSSERYQLSYYMLSHLLQSSYIRRLQIISEAAVSFIVFTLWSNALDAREGSFLPELDYEDHINGRS
jgi:hypothetical protein